MWSKVTDYAFFVILRSFACGQNCISEPSKRNNPRQEAMYHIKLTHFAYEEVGSFERIDKNFYLNWLQRKSVILCSGPFGHILSKES